MYYNFLGFRNPPFEDRPDAAFFFATPSGDEILTSLEHDIHHGSGITLVAGEPGVGKTLMARTLVSRMDASDHLAFVTCPRDGEIDVIRETCKGFGLTLQPSEDVVGYTSRLDAYLSRCAAADHRSVLVVDQAEHLSDTNISGLSTLVDMKGERGPVVTIILFAQPNFGARLETTRSAGLVQRLAATHTIRPLDAAQTDKYVRHRLAVAGTVEAALFDPRAVELIHTTAGGNPRIINRLCHESLVAAYRAEKRVVSESIAQTVTADFANMAGAIVRDSTMATDHSRTSRLAPPDSHSLSGTNTGDAASTPDVDDTATHAQAAELSLLIGRGEALARRLKAALDDSEARQPAVADPPGETADLGNTLIALIERAEQATERAARTETRLSDFAEGLAEKAEVVRQRTTELMGGLEAGEAMRADIERTLQQASAQLDRAQTTQTSAVQVIDRLEARLAGASLQERDQTEELDRHLALCQQKMEAQFRKWEQVIGEKQAAIDARAESTRDTQDELAEQFEIEDRARRTSVKAAESRLRSVMEQASDQIKRVESSLELQKEAAERAKGDVKNACATLTSEAIEAVRVRTSSDVETHRSAVQAAAREMEELDSQLESMTAALQKIATDHGEHVREETRKGREALDQALVECKKAQLSMSKSLMQEIQNSTESFESRKLEFQTKVRDEIETMVHAVADIQAEKLATLRDDVASLNEQLTSGQNRCDDSLSKSDQLSATIEGLSGRVAELQKVIAASGADIDDQFDRVNLVKTDLMESLCRAEDLLRDTRATGGQMETLMRSVHATLVDIGCASQRVEQAQTQLKDAEQTNATLAATAREAARTEGTLTETASKASALSEEMMRLSTDAERKVVQLNSHHAAASCVLRELADTNKESHELIAHTNRTTDQLSTQLDEIRCDAEALGTHLASLTKDSQASSRELKTAVGCATELMQGLSHITDAADESLQSLSACLVDAKDTAGGLQRMCDQSSSIVAEVSGLSRTLDGAAAVRTDIDRAVDQCRTLQEELSMTSERASQERLSLADTHRKAAGLVQELRASTGQAHDSLSRLNETTAQATSTADASEYLLTQFTKQSESLHGVIVALDQRAAQVEENLKRLTDRPGEIVADAQTQAAHLEHVTQIIGKVFARLSKASLEANERAKAVEETSKTASDHVAALCAENERAAQTLKQWTEEAIRVQQRLAHTIAESPTIEQTHAVDSLRRMGDLSRSMPRFANASATDLTAARRASADEVTRRIEAFGVDAKDVRIVESTCPTDGDEESPAAPRVLKSAQAPRDVEIAPAAAGAQEMARQQEIAGMIADAKAVAAGTAPSVD